MKTWEMIKALTEDNKKKFKDSLDSVVGLNEKGELCWLKISETSVENPVVFGKTFYWNNLDVEWKEVEQPVTWQEALEANSKGKRVRVETNSNRCKGYTKTFTNDDLLQDTEWDAMTSLEITTGTWYILD